ncbi:ABC transporter permease [Pseudofrankia sp. DC12]|uniref:ABC transporter permease n=1 Tax=Pseudofrankia sp. DC12 TaxID=683315 RepID=UPI0005F7CC04
MTLLRVERIKLFSTRSPWWCLAIATTATIGLSLLVAATVTKDDLSTFTPASTQFAGKFGSIIMMVMAVMSVTTEYRFSTIRVTFLAFPRRTDALLAKAAVVAGLAGLAGEIAAIGSWAASVLLRPDAPLALRYARDFRIVLGSGLVYAIAAVIAVAAGLLIRHSAGAIATVVIWNLLLEDLLPVIPRIGSHVQHWLPFTAATNFLYDGQPLGTDAALEEHMPLGPWGSLAYFAAFAAALLAVGIIVARRRDA